MLHIFRRTITTLHFRTAGLVALVALPTLSPLTCNITTDCRILKRWGSLQWHKVHITFRENRSVGSKVQMGHKHIHTLRAW
jgi:hypothetical protein